MIMPLTSSTMPARPDAEPLACLPQPDQPARSLAFACVKSSDLLRGQKAVEINHNGSIYRLQATRLGKLILTK